MSKYNNIPSVFSELLDGNLQIDRQVTGPVTLVIGTAYSGPSNAQYLVSDSNKASAIFGSNSPLIKGLSKAKLAGSQNVVLYRIGGKSAQLIDIFGEGTVIETTEQTASAGGQYKVYIGPEPQNEALSCIIIFDNAGKIVYSNVEGAEVNLGKFTIVGFDKEEAYPFRIGTPTVPVLLSAALTAPNIRQDLVLNDTGDGTKTDFDLPGTGGALSALISSVVVDGTTITTGFTVSPNTGTGGLDEIQFAVAPGNADTVVVNYSVSATIAGASYSAGQDNVSASLKKKYELLDSAYADLETTIATHVILAVDGVVLDAANIADGSTATDRLEYLYKTEEFGEFTYEWGTDKVLYQLAAGTTTSPSAADKDDNGQPIVAKQFAEVNFAHQLGTWLHTITENEKFIIGAIGTSQPVATTTSAVARWIGTLPQTDAFGTIVADGSGLLGNRFMAGSTEQQPGFYLTDSGFVDGNPVADSNGAIVDLGKYMSIVAGVIVTPDLKSVGSSIGIENGAAMYGALVSTVSAGNSTTNIEMPRVGLPFVIKKTKLDELSGVGYVTFYTKSTGEVAVTSGELPTGPGSDYDYISTTIIVADIVSKIRARVNPFLGKGLNQAMIAAIDTAVEDIFKAAVKDEGSIVKYAFSVIVEPTNNGRGKVRIPITIVPAFELREVNVPIKLAYDI